MSQTLQKKLIQSGNGTDRPKKGDEVTIQYTGWLYDASATDNQYRGNE
jgi:FK506-binding protein 1